MPRRQRHRVKRIFERLRAEGYMGGYTAVKEAVRRGPTRGQEVFVPLEHRPGETQVDFGQAVVKLNGELRKLFLAFISPNHFAGERCRKEWHARMLPENVRRIASSLEGRALAAWTDRAWPVKTVDRLDTKQRRRLSAGYWAQRGRSLSAAMGDEVVGDRNGVLTTGPCGGARVGAGGPLAVGYLAVPVRCCLR